MGLSLSPSPGGFVTDPTVTRPNRPCTEEQCAGCSTPPLATSHFAVLMHPHRQAYSFQLDSVHPDETVLGYLGPQEAVVCQYRLSQEYQESVGADSRQDRTGARGVGYLKQGPVSEPALFTTRMSGHRPCPQPTRAAIGLVHPQPVQISHRPCPTCWRRRVVHVGAEGLPCVTSLTEYQRF